MMETGIVQEGKAYVAYLNGEKVGRAYDYRGAERFLEKAQGTYTPRRGKNRAPVQSDPIEYNVPRAKAPVTPIFANEMVTSVVNTAAYVPEKDPNFVPFGEFKQIDTIIKSRRFYPIFVTGPTGNGKSTMVEQSCARNKRHYIRLQVNGQTDEDQLIGSKTLVDGNIQIVEGPVLIAMRTGAVLLMDELDAGDPNNVMCLQSILEGKPFYFKLKNEMVYPAPGFTVIATGNTKGRGSDSGKYIGTKMLNEAFLERFPVTFEQEYPTMSVELKIIRNMMYKFNCVDEKFAQTLVKWSDAIRKTYQDGALDDLITTRRLVQIVEGYSIFGNRETAVKLACNRFDSITKSTFIEVFDKISPDETPVVEEVIPVIKEAQPATV
jgi:hypothetical protein